MSLLKTLAEQAQSYQQLYESNQITADEFRELINDMEIIGNIDNIADEFADDQLYRSILVGVVQVASMV